MPKQAHAETSLFIVIPSEAKDLLFPKERIRLNLPYPREIELRTQGGTMSKAQEATTHWYPGTVANKRPSAWWYWGRAVYVSRRDYWRITKKFLAVGIPLAAIGVLFHLPMALRAAWLLAALGLVLLAYSLFGLYRMYGHPGVRYIRRLVELGGEKAKVTARDC